MTNGSGPHKTVGGKKKATAKAGSGTRKPAAELLKKGLKGRAGSGTKGGSR